MPEIPLEYNCEIVHYDCGGIAFYYKGIPEPGDQIRADKAIYPDGTVPKQMERIVCGSCKKTLENINRFGAVGGIWRRERKC